MLLSSDVCLFAVGPFSAKQEHTRSLWRQHLKALSGQFVDCKRKKMAIGSSSILWWDMLICLSKHKTQDIAHELPTQRIPIAGPTQLWWDAPAVQLCRLEIKQCYPPQPCDSAEHVGFESEDFLQWSHFLQLMKLVSRFSPSLGAPAGMGQHSPDGPT